jgi:hypothetical protein
MSLHLQLNQRTLLAVECAQEKSSTLLMLLILVPRLAVNLLPTVVSKLNLAFDCGFPIMNHV